jgi:hypothetical protein
MEITVCPTACQTARLTQPESSPFTILYALFEFLPVESAPQPILRDDSICVPNSVRTVWITFYGDDKIKITRIFY